MPSKLVIRPSVLLLNSALGAGMLISGGQVRAENSATTNARGERVIPQQSETSTFIETHSDGFGDNSAVAALSPSWVQPITASIIPREPFGSAAGAGVSRQSDSAAVPLPLAAWTGLSSLAGLGVISFARNLRRSMK